MAEENSVPQPIETGVEGSQRAGEPSQEANAPLEKLPMAKAITGIAAKKTKAFGGEVQSALLAGATSHIAHELQETKNELRQMREHLDEVKNNFSSCRERKAVLEERIRAEAGTRNFRNLGIAIGSLLVGLAIQLYTEDMSKASVVVAFLGTLLIGFGWLTGPKGDVK